MKKIVKCNINFSEGLRKKVVEAIVDEVRQIEGVKLAEYESMENFNRTVLTFFGDPQSVNSAALAASATALELIDMRKHSGDHPRIGAVDVVTFNPIQNVTLEECIQLSQKFGEEFASRFDVPVYLYDEAATHPDRKDLWNIRTGDYEALAERIVKPEHKPDFGPAEFRPKAGATITGAGKLLVIHYINLGTSDLAIATKIAEAIHRNYGGLVNVKARAIKLEARGITQIPISNVDFEKTPLYRQFELVKTEAARWGIPVVGSELGGMIPLDALLDTIAYYLRLERFKKERIIDLFLRAES